MYAEPYDPQRPVVCFDETSTQLLADVREPLPAQPERPRRQDYEYHRAGARNLFLACEPLAGWRHVAVTERRTMQDFAHQMRWLVDEAYPQPVIRVVLDNLNTHRTASLYETFPAVEARRVAKRLEFHHTPKHGSWLKELARDGGNRVQRAVPLLPEAAAPRRGGPPAGGPSPGHGAKRRPSLHQLEVQYPGRQGQTSPALSLRFQVRLTTSNHTRGFDGCNGIKI